MKVKEVLRTGNVAWSPQDQHPIYLAVGTAAQQLDATFSTSAAIELYQLDLADAKTEMPLKATLPSEHRFHKLAWGKQGRGDEGTVVAGGEQGAIYLYDPKAMLDGAGDKSILAKCVKHSGAVRALDFNKFQANLLASGATESEVLLWDLNNPANAMAPGSKSMPADDVTSVAWNSQVQHILASTFANRCIVWDLRKNEPIIKVSDSVSRLRCSQVCWHPDVATQMALASEDDHSPVIQIWDLRFATSPVRSLENHQRGVLSIAWCPYDADLLLSCGKDNRILCWNPNASVPGGEILYEMPLSTQWGFDVQWCPRNPSVISSCSFDGHVSLYSLMGGIQEIVAKPAVDLSEAFGSAGSAPPPPSTQEITKVVVQPLKKPPKWLRCPEGVSFAFGGKLVSFADKTVTISQVVTDEDLISRATEFQHHLQSGSLADFCAGKAASAASAALDRGCGSHEADVDDDNFEISYWNFLGAHFSPSPRDRWLELLGFDEGVVASKAADLKRVIAERKLRHKSEAVSATSLGEALQAVEQIRVGDNPPNANTDFGIGSPALQHPANSHSAFQHPVNSHSALQHPANSHSALQHPANSHSALQHPANSHSALQHPANSHSPSPFYNIAPSGPSAPPPSFFNPGAQGAPAVFDFGAPGPNFASFGAPASAASFGAPASAASFGAPASLAAPALAPNFGSMPPAQMFDAAPPMMMTAPQFSGAMPTMPPFGSIAPPMPNGEIPPMPPFGSAAPPMPFYNGPAPPMPPFGAPFHTMPPMTGHVATAPPDAPLAPPPAATPVVLPAAPPVAPGPFDFAPTTLENDIPLDDAADLTIDEDEIHLDDAELPVDEDDLPVNEDGLPADDDFPVDEAAFPENEALLEEAQLDVNNEMPAVDLDSSLLPTAPEIVALNPVEVEGRSGNDQAIDAVLNEAAAAARVAAAAAAAAIDAELKEAAEDLVQPEPEADATGWCVDEPLDDEEDEEEEAPEDGSMSSFDIVSSGKPSAVQSETSAAGSDNGVNSKAPSENGANSKAPSENGANSKAPSENDAAAAAEGEDGIAEEVVEVGEKLEQVGLDESPPTPASSLFGTSCPMGGVEGGSSFPASDFDNLVSPPPAQQLFAPAADANENISAFDQISDAFDQQVAADKAEEEEEGEEEEEEEDEEEETEEAMTEKDPSPEPQELGIPCDLDTVDGVIAQSLLVGDLETAVDLCFADDRLADALALASAGSPALVLRTRQRYFEEQRKKVKAKHMARVMSVILENDWEKLVDTCSLDNWRQIMAGILANGGADSSHVIPLGNSLASRLEEEEAFLSCACLIFICAGNQEKVVQLLQKLSPVSSSADVQSLIEKISVLSKVASPKFCATTSSALPKEMMDLVTNYSHLLASQGQLQMAFDYLGLIGGGAGGGGGGEAISATDLRNRLAVALRLARRPAGVGSQAATTASAAASAAARQPSSHRLGNRSRQSSTRSTPRASVSYDARGSVGHVEQPPLMTPAPPMMTSAPPMMTPAAPIMSPAPPMMTPAAPPMIPGPPQPAFSNPAAPPMMQPAVPAMIPASAPPTAPPSAPPSSSAPKRSGLTGRPRYAAHPDIVGSANGGMPYGHQPSQAPSVPSFNPVVNQPPAFSGPAASSTPAPPSMFNPAESISTPAAMAPPAAPPMTPLQNAASGPPPMTPLQNAVSGPPPMESSPAPSIPVVPSFQSAPPPNYGWNDPPSAAAAAAKSNQNSNLRKLKPTKAAVAPMELPAGMLNPAAYVPQQRPLQQQQHNPMAPPAFSAGAPPATAWMNPNTTAAPSNGVPAYNPAPPAAAAPSSAVHAQPTPPPSAPVVVKKAIPAEHQMLFDTFADALSRCQGATKNPVMKRKLDDVFKKLEILADKLREGAVSPNVLSGLQQMASAVGQKDYQNGLKVYALIIRGGNFAEISSFMPGLKTLMQSATQLKV